MPNVHDTVGRGNRGLNLPLTVPLNSGSALFLLPPTSLRFFLIAKYCVMLCTFPYFPSSRPRTLPVPSSPPCRTLPVPSSPPCRTLPAPSSPPCRTLPAPSSPPCRTLPVPSSPPCRTLPVPSSPPCRTLPVPSSPPCRTLPVPSSPPCRTLPAPSSPPCRTLPVPSPPPCRTLPAPSSSPCRTLPAPCPPPRYLYEWFFVPEGKSRSGTPTGLNSHRCDSYRYEILERYDVNGYEATRANQDELVVVWESHRNHVNSRRVQNHYSSVWSL